MRRTANLPRSRQDMMLPGLPLMRGCSNAKCKYCSERRYYEDKFELASEEEIDASIAKIAAEATLITRKVYLEGANALCLSTRRLIEIFDKVEAAIPTVRGYSSYACVGDIASKSDEDLKLLASRGLDGISIGVESGLDSVLDFMDKGHSVADAITQCQRLHDAGIKFSLNYMPGLAGHGHGQENAIASAEAFSKMNPERIYVFTITPTPDWRLREDIEAGAYELPGEIEAVEEIRTFVEHLDWTGSLVASHDANVVRFEGVLPKDQENMLKLLDHMLGKINEEASRRTRLLIGGFKRNEI